MKNVTSRASRTVCSVALFALAATLAQNATPQTAAALSVRGPMRTVLAFIAAIALPTVIMVGWYLYGQFQVFEADDPYIWGRTRGFLGLTAVIVSGFVLVLGLPAYLLLRYLKLVRWWSTLSAGFILGALPMAIFTWPLKYSDMKSSSSVNGVQTMIDGVPTTAGWLQYVEGVLFFGAFGLAAAFVFWLVAPAQQDAASGASA